MVLCEGVLIEEKEWWQSIEYACDNEMIEYAFKKVQLFFLLGVGCEDGISLFLRSQGFQWVSMMFSKFPMWSSRVFPITFHFISYPLPNDLFFHQKGEARGKIFHLHWGAFQVLGFFDDGPIKMAYCKEKKPEKQPI
jgi:hypothetical protein